MVDFEGAPKGSLAATPVKVRVDGAPYAGRVRVLMRGAPLVQRDGGVPAGIHATVVPAALVEKQEKQSEPIGRAAPQQPPAPTPPGRGVTGARTGGGAAPKFDVVEVVPIESYLSGVIVSEMPKQWPLGAFQVQAVCARTYALHERQRALKSGRAWDLEAGEIDQAYNGGIEVPTAMKAVADTRGVVLTTEGHLLRAYYSSTCGGRTAGAASIWPTGPGFEFNLDAPIQSNPRESACQGSPVYRWSVTRDRSDLSKQIREWGKANGQPVAKMGLVQSLEVAQSNPVGRPTKYTITDDSGMPFPIAAELLRVACNYGTAGVRPITKESRVRSGDMEMEVTPSGVVVRGRGFGHGVGMCQYCAKAMAERGDAWQEMIARFYPGAKLERAY
jgi:SpoIID/LytB domain protein